MKAYSDSIILIGMPGAGKSTIGVLLAKYLGKNFVDTDILIQNKTGERLQTIVNERGYLALRKIEEDVLLDLQLSNDVVATGGSVVYSEKAMAHLERQGRVVYLQVSLEELTRRVSNLDDRGLACKPGQSFEDLYNERVPLYERYGQVTISCDGKTAEAIVLEIATIIEQH